MDNKTKLLYPENTGFVQDKTHNIVHKQEIVRHLGDKYEKISKSDFILHWLGFIPLGFLILLSLGGGITGLYASVRLILDFMRTNNAVSLIAGIFFVIVSIIVIARYGRSTLKYTFQHYRFLQALQSSELMYSFVKQFGVLTEGTVDNVGEDGLTKYVKYTFFTNNNGYKDVFPTNSKVELSTGDKVVVVCYVDTSFIL